MGKILLQVLLGVSLVASEGWSSIRVDLGDERPPAKVLERSISLAKTQPFANVTGAVWTNGNDLSTGIAIDPYTVLTCAHSIDLSQTQNIVFRLHPNAVSWDGNTAKVDGISITKKPIIHESFRLNKVDNYDNQLSFDGHKLFLNGIEYNEQLQNGSYEQLRNSPIMNKAPFSGVDLAILKLDSPLPKGLVFPEILDPDFLVSNLYGSSMGYGRMYYNYQEHGPAFATVDPEKLFVRHLISTKVNPLEYNGLKLLCSQHTGLFINGIKSFIPNDDMMKTEGSTVEGDSGGPLIIKTGNDYKLAGIMSECSTINWAPIIEFSHRQALKKIKQPIFNAWIDVRHYAEWVRSHMGPL